MNKILLFALLAASVSYGQTYPPEAESPGSTAVHKDSPLYVAWATGITVERGYLNISNPDFMIGGSNRVSSGTPENALGAPTGPTVSLGDRGTATLTFARPISNGEGFDFAVFENGGPGFLELAFVEVSSDGIHFFRFPAHSQTQTDTQIGSFGSPSAPYLNNLAGKYAGSYGTPFDLSELPNDALLNKNNITHVRIIDVVGAIDPLYASYDALGNAVNESFPTPFISGGFDLQAVGVFHEATLGMGDFSKSKLLLYPNPAKDYFRLTVGEPATVIVYDVSGRQVLQQQIEPAGRIAVSDLDPGVYFVAVTINGQQQKSLQRLIVQ